MLVPGYDELRAEEVIVFEKISLNDIIIIRVITVRVQKSRIFRNFKCFIGSF